ncbi:DUF3854 domain-containing protein [Planococcus lenghuensis]|nr:DUF3854 domain-containing protein [Planococcus lenghuensis]
MRGTLRRTRLKDWYEVTKEACPICHKSGGCMIHADGNRVVCIRIESKKVFSKQFTSWLHFLKEPVRVNTEDMEDYLPAQPKAPITQLNAVYSALLDNIRLEENHYAQLTGESRGLTDSEVAIREYRSFPRKPWVVTKQLEHYVDAEAFHGTPGFYTNRYGWTIAGMQGLLIPYRNERNQIGGFQVRVDEPGLKAVLAGSFKDKVTAEIIERPNRVQVKINGEVYKETCLEEGERLDIQELRNYGVVTLKKGQRYFWVSSANKENGTGAGNPMPVHVAVPVAKLKDWQEGTPHRAKSVGITEGALKADIAVEHMARLHRAGKLELTEESPTMLALPGVNTWMNILPMLETMGTEEVTIYFDMDMLSNPDVLRATKQMLIKLKEEGYKVNLSMWSEEDGKGIDDVFLQGKFPQIKQV